MGWKDMLGSAVSKGKESVSKNVTSENIVKTVKYIAMESIRILQEQSEKAKEDRARLESLTDSELFDVVRSDGSDYKRNMAREVLKRRYPHLQKKRTE